MAYSYVLRVGDGTTNNFTFNFGYLSRDHISVSVGGVPTPFTFLTDFSVQITPAPAIGEVIEIRRRTPLDEPIVDWTDGTVLTEVDMDLNSLFALYAAQEAADLGAVSVTQDSEGVWDGQGRTTTNFADPEDMSGLVTRNYFENTYTPLLDSKVAAAQAQAQAAAGSAAQSGGYAAAADESADLAAQLLGLFRGQYLGPQEVPPVVDGNGNPVTVGDLYFDTIAAKLRVYTGESGWQDATSVIQGYINKPTYPVVAEGGQTEIEVPTGYDPHYIIVFLNGVIVSAPDIDVTSGTVIRFTSPLDAGDEVTWVAFGTFEVTDLDASNITYKSTTVQSAIAALESRNAYGIPYGVMSVGVALDALQGALQGLNADTISYGSTTVGEALDDLQDLSAADISYNGGTVKEALDGGQRQLTHQQAVTTSFPSTVTTIQTVGYYNPGDGGAAVYKRVTTQPTHNGKFQSADGAWWELVVSERRVSVAQFGAMSGVANSATRIQQALDYLGVKWNGGTLFIPAGVYPMNAGLVFDRANGLIEIEGEHRHNTFLQYQANVNGIVLGNVNALSNAEIRNLTLTMDRVCTGGKYAVKIRTGNGTPRSTTIKNVTAYGGSVGGNINDGYWDGGGFYLLNPVYPVIHDCYFFGIGGVGTIARSSLIDAGFMIHATEGAVIFANLQNCFANGTRYGFHLFTESVPGIEGMFMDSCNFNGNITGIRAATNKAANPTYYPPEYVFDKCQVEPLETGIAVDHAAMVTIRDCTVLMDPTANVAHAGIVLADVKFAVVDGNFVEFRPVHTTGTGIRIVGHTDQAVISNNNILSPEDAIAIRETAKNIRAYSNHQRGPGPLLVDSSTNKATNSSSVQKGMVGFSSDVEGIKECWGRTVVELNASGTAYVTFPEPFRQMCYGVSVTNNNYAAGEQVPMVSTLSTAGFTVKMPGGQGPREIFYVAKGI